MQPSTATLPSAADALTALNSYQQPDSASVLGQAQQQYGVQGLQDRVNTYKTLTNNLTGALAAVDPSVTGRTAGSLVTEGQRSALVNREQAPITTELGTANTGLSGANSDLNTANTNANNSANMTISDNKDKAAQLLQTYQIANQREQDAAAAAADAAKTAESTREFNVGQANENSRAASSAAASVDPAAGYAVKYKDGSGDKAYTGPNGVTNLYQYASAIAGGDPNGTYQNILSQLNTGSATDKAAYAKVKGMSQAAGIAYLQKNNKYIFS